MPTGKTPPVPKAKDRLEKLYRKIVNKWFNKILDYINGWNYNHRSDLPAKLDSTEFDKSINDLKKFVKARPEVIPEAIDYIRNIEMDFLFKLLGVFDISERWYSKSKKLNMIKMKCPKCDKILTRPTEKLIIEEEADLDDYSDIEFDINKFEELAEKLTVDQLYLLASEVSKSIFYCNKCQKHFSFKGDDIELRKKFAKEIFSFENKKDNNEK